MGIVAEPITVKVTREILELLTTENNTAVYISHLYDLETKKYNLSSDGKLSFKNDLKTAGVADDIINSEVVRFQTWLSQKDYSGNQLTGKGFITIFGIKFDELTGDFEDFKTLVEAKLSEKKNGKPVVDFYAVVTSLKTVEANVFFRQLGDNLLKMFIGEKTQIIDLDPGEKGNYSLYIANKKPEEYKADALLARTIFGPLNTNFNRRNLYDVTADDVNDDEYQTAKANNIMLVLYAPGSDAQTEGDFMSIENPVTKAHHRRIIDSIIFAIIQTLARLLPRDDMSLDDRPNGGLDKISSALNKLMLEYDRMNCLTRINDVPQFDVILPELSSITPTERRKGLLSGVKVRVMPIDFINAIEINLIWEEDTFI